MHVLAQISFDAWNVLKHACFRYHIGTAYIYTVQGLKPKGVENLESGAYNYGIVFKVTLNELPIFTSCNGPVTSCGF